MGELVIGIVNEVWWFKNGLNITLNDFYVIFIPKKKNPISNYLATKIVLILDKGLLLGILKTVRIPNVIKCIKYSSNSMFKNKQTHLVLDKHSHR